MMKSLLYLAGVFRRLNVAMLNVINFKQCVFHFYAGIVSIASLYVYRKQPEAQAQEGELQRAQLQ